MEHKGLPRGLTEKMQVAIRLFNTDKSIAPEYWNTVPRSASVHKDVNPGIEPDQLNVAPDSHRCRKLSVISDPLCFNSAGATIGGVVAPLFLIYRLREPPAAGEVLTDSDI